MSISIRPLRAGDREQWLHLWRGYLTFYESEVPAEVTDLTWSRILDPEAPIHGLCAVDEGGRLLGIVHYLFHPVTWAAGPRCYLEDLFTAAEARGRGAGRALIEAVYAAAGRTRRRSGLLVDAGHQCNGAPPLRSGSQGDAIYQIPPLTQRTSKFTYNLWLLSAAIR